jgi:hypothetical protein
MENNNGLWVLEISLRDCSKAHSIIQDMSRTQREAMEWVSTDTASIWNEDLADEITHRLDAQRIEFSIKSLN